MASKVFLYIGLPKTGTTYLQSILWDSRDRLAADGVLLPGEGHREHLWAALELRGSPGLARRHRSAPGALGRLVAQANAHPGAAVLSHEFMCGAGRRQARRLVESLQPAEVHVVITARDALGMLTAGWAEYVKNGGVRSLGELADAPGKAPQEFSWRTWDLGGVLQRWTPRLPADRVHVLTMPAPGSAPDQHWRNLASVLGVDPSAYSAPRDPVNPALGVVQLELLRRVNAHLRGFGRAVDRGTWIRGYLAEGHLAGQEGVRAGADAAQVEDCRRRADEAVRVIAERGFHVVGDLGSLQVPEVVPQRPTPGDVDDGALVEAGARLIADMLTDIRRSSRGPVREGSLPEG